MWPYSSCYSRLQTFGMCFLIHHILHWLIIKVRCLLCIFHTSENPDAKFTTIKQTAEDYTGGLGNLFWYVTRTVNKWPYGGEIRRCCDMFPTAEERHWAMLWPASCPPNDSLCGHMYSNFSSGGDTENWPYDSILLKAVRELTYG